MYNSQTLLDLFRGWKHKRLVMSATAGAQLSTAVPVSTCYLRKEKEATALLGHMTSQLIISTSA